VFITHKIKGLHRFIQANERNRAPAEIRLLENQAIALGTVYFLLEGVETLRQNG